MPLPVSQRCICVVVADKALNALLEGHGAGAYRDSHPWVVGRELLDAAIAASERMAVLFARGSPVAFSHWAFVNAIEVQELHKGAWQTRCEFDPPAPVNPIWQPLDSLVLAPSDEQLHRERVEPVRVHRQLLDVTLIHPYAVCETPAFILGGENSRGIR